MRKIIKFILILFKFILIHNSFILMHKFNKKIKFVYAQKYPYTGCPTIIVPILVVVVEGNRTN